MYQINIFNNEFRLERYPFAFEKNLFPWNEADIYLLNQLSLETNELNNLNQFETLIINDQYGVLSTGLFNMNPYTYIDSFLSLKALKTNYKINKLIFQLEQLIHYQNIDHLLKHNIKFVLIKAPKSNTYLLYLLSRIKKYLADNAVILCSGMTKHISPNLSEILISNIGQTSVLPVRKKAVLFKSVYSNKTPSLLTTTKINCPELLGELQIFSYPNTFSNDKIDSGTRFLLENLPQDISGNVADLGCGNGLISLYIKKKYPNTNVFAFDESYEAIHSLNFNKTFNNISLKSVLSDGLFNSKKKFDWVVSNPPFHFNNVVDFSIAYRHFSEVFEKLLPGGKFFLVYNNHLNYYTHLKKIFPIVIKYNSNQKYSLLLCIKKKL